MNCNCNTIYISNVTTTDTGVVLIPNREVKNLTNIECYGLVICCNAAATANLPVFIQTTLGNIPVLCKAGNTVYANQLKTRMRYTIMYGNENAGYADGQFVIQNCICPRSTIAATTNEESI